jgi:hypothetical protein
MEQSKQESSYCTSSPSTSGKRVVLNGVNVIFLKLSIYNYSNLLTIFLFFLFLCFPCIYLHYSDASLANIQLRGFETTLGKRLRVTESTSVFHFNHNYGKESDKFDESLQASATSTFSDKSYVAMDVTNIGDRAVRQSYEYIPYTSGTTKQALLIGLLSASSTTQPSGIRSRIGLFDDTADKTVDTAYGNGVFFQLQSGVFSVVLRTSTSTLAQTDTAVAQSAFNLDIMDGTGTSKVTFDPYKVHTFVIDMSMTGSGHVRMGILDGADPVYFHEFNTPAQKGFIKSAALPIRYEISNTAAATTSDELRVMGGSVVSDCANAPRFRTKAFNLGSSSIQVAGEMLPLLSIRLEADCNRAQLVLDTVNLLTNVSVLFEVYVSGTLTGASWQPVSDYAEIDSSATDIFGGTLLSSVYCDGATALKLGDDAIVQSNIAGVSSIITICASKIYSTASVLAAITWKELY